jgi:predicted GNAT family acetyltransferase
MALEDAGDMVAATVVNNPGLNRYEVRREDELVGFVTYRERPGLIAFVHTETDNRFEGQGLASRLIAGALDDVRERGLEVLPFCPFANSYIQRHPEYADLVPEAYREQFHL